MKQRLRPYNELLLDRVADQADVAVEIGEIKKAGDRAGRLTSQLLAFSGRLMSVSSPGVVS